MRRKLGILLLKVLYVTVLAVIIMLLPPPPGSPEWLARVQAPVVIFVFICVIGKLLYDTLFYDHYVP